MKDFKISIAWLAMFALVFTSCSKEEADPGIEDQELIQISFGSLMNDFNDQNKQATPGECRQGTPSYVWVGITDDDGNYIGDDGGTSEVNLIEVALKYNTSLEVWETHYSDELALPAGNYELQHFIVYDTNNQVLWVAPREEGAFADYVGDPLPQDIILAAGTKPYITVDVLCYISRSEEAFGYVFFDINLERVENSYCVFVNYCDDTTGREYPANFRFDVWSDGYGGSSLVVSGVNTVDMTGDWPAASVLCLALPEIVGADLYARVTVLDDGQGYTPGAGDVYEFRISQDDIDDQDSMTPSYDHVRINCGDDDPGNGGGNGGGDEDCDVIAQCVLDVSGDVEGDFCNVTSLEGSDGNGWVRVDSAEEFNLVYSEAVGGASITVATVDVSLNASNELTVVLDTPEDEVEVINETDHITAYAIEVRPHVGDGEVRSDECWETVCESLIEEYGSISNSFDGLTYEYPVYVKVTTVSCFDPVD